MNFTKKKLKEFKRQFPHLYYHENNSLDPLRQADIAEAVEDFLTTAIQEAVDQQHQELREKIEELRSGEPAWDIYDRALDDVLKLLP